MRTMFGFGWVMILLSGIMLWIARVHANRVADAAEFNDIAARLDRYDLARSPEEVLSSASTAGVLLDLAPFVFLSGIILISVALAAEHVRSALSDKPRPQ